MATLCASVPPRGKAKGFEKGTDKGKGKGKGSMSTNGPIRKQRERARGNPRGPMFGTLLDMRRRALCGELPLRARARGLIQVGEPEVFDQWEPEEWGSPEIRTLSHIHERDGSTQSRRVRARRGWTLIDFVKKRRRQGEVKKAKKEKSSGGEDHPHHRARDGQQCHDQEQVGSHSTSRWTAARRRP